ncbi:MAG: hypothetical protein IPH77_06135 [Ignavibacteria bacterium]|nr:hypothetical protein [Ignavibacteria bacterium]
MLALFISSVDLLSCSGKAMYPSNGPGTLSFTTKSFGDGQGESSKYPNATLLSPADRSLPSTNASQLRSVGNPLILPSTPDIASLSTDEPSVASTKYRLYSHHLL